MKNKKSIDMSSLTDEQKDLLEKSKILKKRLFLGLKCFFIGGTLLFGRDFFIRLGLDKQFATTIAIIGGVTEITGVCIITSNFNTPLSDKDADENEKKDAEEKERIVKNM